MGLADGLYLVLPYRSYDAGLLVSNQTANLLDCDQIEEIQANASEALANVTKLFEAQGLVNVIHRMGVQPFIIMCGSKNIQVLRHAPLVIGNIAQTDEHREGKEQLVTGF